MKKTRFTAIILAAGCGSRMAADKTKQLMTIGGESVVGRSIRAFNDCPDIDDIIVVSRPDEIDRLKNDICVPFAKVVKVICGGKTRAESAKLGFCAISDECTHVAIHDAARCLVEPSMISKVAIAAINNDAATAVSSVTDTVKKVSESGFIEGTISRSELVRATTPQMFRVELYKEALEKTNADSSITDDNMLLERIGVKIATVDLGNENIKITTPSDIGLAEHILSKREGKTVADCRIGHGYDVHKFACDRALVLGGVNVPCEYGLLGHSDADVLVHAIMDSLLGAAGLGDIGRHFPDSSDEYKGISSIELLRRVRDLILKEGYIVSNVDATLIMQKPKIAPYVNDMVANIANALQVSKPQINVKATTEEGLGFTGNGQGAAAHAVAIITKK